MNNVNIVTKDLIRSILIDQRDHFVSQDIGIERSILPELKKVISSPQIVLITGLRRVGKSTLLAQIAKKYFKSNYYYVSFEDERLNAFNVKDFDILYQVLLEEYGEQSYFFFDEIQNIAEWERFVRRMHDKGLHFIITGSNASLLSKELGTRLTGRYIQIDLLPFSFQEYLVLKNFQIGNTTKQKSALERHLKQYLIKGGIPNALKYPEINIHQNLYNDVIFRDIVARYNLENIRSIKELGSYILGNIATLISYNKLKDLLKLGSVTTIKNYIEYFSDSWLFFIVNKYAYSIKEQTIAAKKIYGIDNGLITSLGFNFSKNTGRLIENVLYLHLKRDNQQIYYYKTKAGKEIDFYLPGTNILIQVTTNLDNVITTTREVSALLEAYDEWDNIHKPKLLLITQDENVNIKIDSRIKVIRLSEYLLTT